MTDGEQTMTTAAYLGCGRTRWRSGRAEQHHVALLAWYRRVARARQGSLYDTAKFSSPFTKVRLRSTWYTVSGS